MVAINNRVSGKVEEHGASFTATTTGSGYEATPLRKPEPYHEAKPRYVSEESRAQRIEFIRKGGGHASYGPDDNPRGQTPGDDGWNSPPTPGQRATAAREMRH